MTDVEIIDQFIRELYVSGTKSRSLESIVKARAQRYRIESILLEKNLVNKQGSTVATVSYFVISGKGIELINTHGSYSSYLIFIDENNALQQEINRLTVDNLTLQNVDLRRKVMYSIIGFIAGALLTIAIGLLPYLFSNSEKEIQYNSTGKSTHQDAEGNQNEIEPVDSLE